MTEFLSKFLFSQFHSLLTIPIRLYLKSQLFALYTFLLPTMT